MMQKNRKALDNRTDRWRSHLCSTIRSLDVVVGGQYGHEGTDKVVGTLINRYHGRTDENAVTVNVKVGGREQLSRWATLKDGELGTIGLRMMPTGAVFSEATGAKGDVICAFGPETVIHIEQLREEIKMLTKLGFWSDERMLVVDPNATVITNDDLEREEVQHLSDVTGVRCTGEYSGRSARIMRRAYRVEERREEFEDLPGVVIASLSHLFSVPQSQMSANVLYHVIVEGSGGYAQGLHTALYPNGLSTDNTAMHYLAQAGINPSGIEPFNVYVVFRPYPIRHRHDNGPMHAETSWEDLGLADSNEIELFSDWRVGEWDAALAQQAMIANGTANTMVFMALNDVWLIDEKVYESDSFTEVKSSPAVSEFMTAMAVQTDGLVRIVITSSHTAALAWRY